MRTRAAILIAIAFAACQKQESPATASGGAAAPTPAASATAAPPAAEAQQITGGLQAPESVLYDAQQDVYFISNINGQPDAADNNGYISRVNPETLQADVKWIESGKNGATLNAPKGLAIAGDTLYVCDLTVVRKFDAKTGAPKGGIAIPGSTFLNDAVADGMTIYVSDSGSDAIWKIEGDKPAKVASGKDLKGPNGLAIVGGKVWAASLSSNELYGIDKGKKFVITTLPKGGLDGLLHMSDNTFVVTSWEAKAVYRGQPSGGFKTIVENVNGPADIGYDTKRHRLLLPHLMDNIVTIHPLQ